VFTTGADWEPVLVVGSVLRPEDGEPPREGWELPFEGELPREVGELPREVDELRPKVGELFGVETLLWLVEIFFAICRGLDGVGLRLFASTVRDGAFAITFLVVEFFGASACKPGFASLLSPAVTG